MQAESPLISLDELARLREAPTELLAAAVQIEAGTQSALPSPGQEALLADVLVAMKSAGQVAAVAPDVAWLPVLAAVVTSAVECGERSLLSASSPSQLRWLRDEMVPVALAASQLLFPDTDVDVAFVHSPGGYVDPAKVIATAQLLTGATTVSFSELASLLERGPGRLPDAQRLGGVENVERVRDLVVWALHTYVDDTVPGDRSSCPVSHTTTDWGYVSAGADVADSGERFGVESKARVAMRTAAGAHIVITTHPALFSLQEAGEFDHVVIDEADALPAVVHQQGTSWLMGGNVVSTARRAWRAAGSPPGDMEAWRDAADTIAAEIDEVLRGQLHESSGRGRLAENFTALDRMAPLVGRWVQKGAEYLALVRESDDVRVRVEANTASARLRALLDSTRAVTWHKPGWNRWVELQPVRPDAAPTDRPWVIGVSAPNAVGFILTDSLWFQPSENKTDEMVPRSVICMASTMPDRFPSDVGLQCSVRDYTAAAGDTCASPNVKEAAPA